MPYRSRSPTASPLNKQKPPPAGTGDGHDNREESSVSELDRTNGGLVFAADGELFTSSLIIAAETGNEHTSVMKLIKENGDDLIDVGLVRFQIRPRPEGQHGGGDVQYAELDEPAATLLMTYLRNSPVVKDLKKRLVGGFYKMRQLLAVDLSDPLAEIEAANARSQKAVEIARFERNRAEKAERRADVESRHRKAIEGGDGILLTDFGKKYFSEVRHTDFFEHLYAKKWLIDQRGTRINDHGEVRDGHDHRKPTYKGRPFIYEHDTGNHGGKRRFQSRVRPQREVDLRDALAAEGLPVNEHSTGLVLISSDELKGIGA